MLAGHSIFGGADELEFFYWNEAGSVFLYCRSRAFSCHITRIIMNLSVEDLEDR